MTISAKKITALVCALSLFAGLAGCGRTVLTGGDSASATTSGGKVSVSSAADGKFSLFYDKGQSMNPLKTSDTNNQLVCALVYENMVEVDGSFSVTPGVVSKYESSDGVNWALTVDTSHMFSDGSAVSAGDVAFSLRTAINSARFENRFSGWITAISSSDGVVNVTLSRANMLFPRFSPCRW